MKCYNYSVTICTFLYFKFDHICVHNDDFCILLGKKSSETASGQLDGTGNHWLTVKLKIIHIQASVTCSTKMSRRNNLNQTQILLSVLMEVSRLSCSKTTNDLSHLFSFPLGMTDSRSVLFLSLHTYVFLRVMPTDAVLFCTEENHKWVDIKTSCFSLFHQFVSRIHFGFTDKDAHPLM